MKYYFRVFSLFMISIGEIDCSDFCRSFIAERTQAVWTLKDGSTSFVYGRESLQTDLNANEVDKHCQKIRWEF